MVYTSPVLILNIVIQKLLCTVLIIDSIYKQIDLTVCTLIIL